MNIIISKNDAKELNSIVELYASICKDDLESGLISDKDTCLYYIETCKKLSKIIKKAIRSSSE